MAFEGTANIFSLLRSGREGVQFERTFRVVSFILHQWYEYRGDRHPDASEPKDKIRAIPFDKLVTLVARLWDGLYARHEILEPDQFGGGVRLALHPEKVTFPCPLRELPGKHGPGRAIYNGQGRPEFVLSVLYKLQQDDIIHYFTITVPGTPGGIGVQRQPSPADPDTIITPAVPITNKKIFLERFTAREIEIVSDLANAIKKLNPSEIRALGTHENCDKTIRAVQWEFGALKRLGIQESIRTAITASAAFRDSSQEWLEYAGEACFKGQENRSNYTGGWGTMKVELADPEVQEVFGLTQASAAEIWESPVLGRLYRIAAKSRSLSLYFRAVSMSLEGIHSRFEDRPEQARNSCRDLGVPTLPDSASLFALDGTLLPRVQQLLKDVLDQMFQEMLSC